MTNFGQIIEIVQSILLNIPHLIFEHFSCAPAWSEREHLGYNLFLFTVGFFIPLCVIIAASMAVMVQLRKVSVRVSLRLLVFLLCN